MQPANLSLDPMASLWSTNPGGSPNSGSNYFSQPASASPDQNAGTNSNVQNRTNDNNFDINSGYYTSPPQNSGQKTDQSPSFAQTTTGDGNSSNGGGGDTFMGAGTPGPGGVGLGGWKFTVMDGNK